MPPNPLLIGFSGSMRVRLPVFPEVEPPSTGTWQWSRATKSQASVGRTDGSEIGTNCIGPR